MATKSTPETEKARKSDKDSLLLRALHGRLLNSDLFSRYWLQIVGIIAMMLLFMVNKYECQMSMEEIQRLNKDLEVIKTERVRAQREYMSRIRESSMQQLVDRHHLQLRIQPQPPYRLTLSDNNE
ncbi:MAG: hypothetical protein K2M76_03710 [Muribaculaceae bacterium]|nr:hypothetical protein [Muribaculaceae bacterium]